MTELVSFYIKAMSSCLETFGSVGPWVINLLNCLEPCLKYRVVELIISVVSVVLGLVDVITDQLEQLEGESRTPGAGLLH